MGLTKIDDRGLKTPIDLLDNEKIRLGTGNDLTIEHTGNNDHIESGGSGFFIDSVGQQQFRSNSHEKMAVLIPDGAVELYYDNSKKLETTAGGVTITGTDASDGTIIKGDLRLHKEGGAASKIKWDGSEGTDGHLEIFDDVKLTFGTGSDLQIYHTGSQSRIENAGTGELRIQSDDIQIVDKEANDFHIKCVHDAQVELYYDNSKKLETVTGGVYVYGDIVGGVGGTGNISLGDSSKFIAGSGNDLQIYHDGSASIIENSTGNLAIRGKTGENHIVMIPDSKTALYHDGSKKFETTTAGITVTSTGNTPQTDYVGASNNTLGRIDCDAISSTTSNMRFYVETGGSIAEKLRIQTGGGISFNGDTASANALDDYEEGSFTPALGGMSSISYHRQHGYYTKIGRQVWMHIYLYVYQATGNSNKIRITNLPFTASNASSGYIQHGGTLWYQNDTFKSSFNSESKPSIYIDSGDSFARFISQAGSEINGNDTYLGSGANNRYIICGLQMIV